MLLAENRRVAVVPGTLDLILCRQSYPAFTSKQRCIIDGNRELGDLIR